MPVQRALSSNYENEELVFEKDKKYSDIFRILSNDFKRQTLKFCLLQGCKKHTVAYKKY